MSKNPTIAALKERLEVERNDEMTAYELCTGQVGYRNGHAAATARLMPILDQAVEVIKKYEPYCIINFVESEVKGFNSYKIKEFWLAREFLLSISETVADASTLADASGDMNKEGCDDYNNRAF